MGLAAHLGGMTVSEVLVRMDDHELDLWAAYEEKHGFAQQRTEMMLARLAYMQSDGKSSLGDFMLKPREPERPTVRAEQMTPDLELIGTNVHVLKVARYPWQDKLDEFDRAQARKGR